MFAFWEQYCDMVNALLQQINAERFGNWDLYLSTLAVITPDFYAFDRPNYSRWLPIYIEDMRTGSVTLNNFYCDFLRVGSRVARFKAFFFFTELQMANVWTNKPCQSSLKGLKMFTDAQPWGRGESKLNLRGKQCKLKKI